MCVLLGTFKSYIHKYPLNAFHTTSTSQVWAPNHGIQLINWEAKTGCEIKTLSVCMVLLLTSAIPAPNIHPWDRMTSHLSPLIICWVRCSALAIFVGLAQYQVLPSGGWLRKSPKMQRDQKVFARTHLCDATQIHNVCVICGIKSINPTCHMYASNFKPSTNHIIYIKLYIYIIYISIFLTYSSPILFINFFA